MIRAIHPVGCACTDCLTGRSVPVDQAPIEVFDAYVAGYCVQDSRDFFITDASGTTEREFDEWLERAENRG